MNPRGDPIEAEDDDAEIEAGDDAYGIDEYELERLDRLCDDVFGE